MADKEAQEDSCSKDLPQARKDGESPTPYLLEVPFQQFSEQTADSGTESGEDLRTGLILEVQNALEKLSACLCNDSTDISQERRNSLLQLVTKLQTNLGDSNAKPEVPEVERRLSAGGSRYCRKRQNQNQKRHTVGVTSEELEDARKLMKEFSIGSDFNQSIDLIDEGIKKEFDNSNLITKTVANTLPKPFVSNNSSGTSSTVETPSILTPDFDFKDNNSQQNNMERKFERQSFSFDMDMTKPRSPIIEPLSPINPNMFSEKPSQQQHQVPEGQKLVLYDQSIYNDQKSVENPVFLHVNPLYQQVEPADEKLSKKLKMKRANTIDIPKRKNVDHFESRGDVSDGEFTENEDDKKQKYSNYMALRGPIRVGQNVPKFEAKTESDKKFLAFINKQHEQQQEKQKALWGANNLKVQKEPEGSNWTRKFGNIKTNFEGKVQPNSAKNFWKTAENNQANHNRPFTYRSGSQNYSNNDESKYNNLNHNPHRSAFRPVTKSAKPDLIDFHKETPLYLYSPKEPKSPNEVWNANVQKLPNERRVLSLAASKFEQKKPEEVKVETKVRRLSKENLIPQRNVTEKVVTYIPPMSKASTGGSVRKLSDQYDCLDQNIKQNQFQYVAHSNIKYQHQQHVPNHQSAFAQVPQTKSQKSMEQFPSKIQDIPTSFQTTDRRVQELYQNQNYQKPQVYYNNTTKTDYIQPQHDQFRPALESQTSHESQNQNYQKPQGYYNNIAKPNYSQPQDDQFRPALESQTSHESQNQNYQKPQVYYNNIAKPNYSQPEDDQFRPTLESQTSQESVHEYLAVSSKVMSGPVSQQAVTVSNQPKSRDQHDLGLLQSTVQSKAKSKSPLVMSPKFSVNDKPLEALTPTIEKGKFNHKNMLAKSDSWHQICMQQDSSVAKKPSPRGSPNYRPPNCGVMKSKSTHSLAIPQKQFEAAMGKEEVVHKKRTLEAYFGSSINSSSTAKTPNGQKRSINRIKTSQKLSAVNSSAGLCRSRTLPDIVCTDLLDESNVDEAFEDLFKSAT